jgi:hypothetical protein
MKVCALALAESNDTRRNGDECMMALRRESEGINERIYV